MGDTEEVFRKLGSYSLDGVIGPPPFQALPIGFKGAHATSNLTSHPSENTSNDKHVVGLSLGRSRVQFLTL
jgi:hypothetical protein